MFDLIIIISSGFFASILYRRVLVCTMSLLPVCCSALCGTNIPYVVLFAVEKM